MQNKRLISTFNAKAVTDSGVVVGYLNNFNNVDHVGDMTLKGAFLKSIMEIKASGRDMPMLYQHEHSEPIGVWKNIREDEIGLIAEGHINLETQKGREVYALAKQGALSGISIGYFVVDEEYDRAKGVNYLKEVSLLEASIVTFPCNELSRIDQVKVSSLIKGDRLPHRDELERYLKASGVSSDLSIKIANHYHPEANANDIPWLSWGDWKELPVTADEPRDDVTTEDMDEKEVDEDQEETDQMEDDKINLEDENEKSWAAFGSFA